MKKCPKCKKDFPKQVFIGRTGYKIGYCKLCEKERQKIKQKKSYLANPQKIIAASQKWFSKNRERAYATNKIWRETLKDKILEHYGKECECCGEKEKIFLTIDHINGNGRQERKIANGGGWHNYRSIINENFPKNKYRILCYNCNCGRAKNKGICPHKK